MFGLLLVLFGTSPLSCHATIAAEGLLFDSMPAVFGLPWVSHIQYQAHLQVISGRQFLCENDDTIVESSGDRRRLQHTEPHATNDDLPIALLVSRGACSFEEKSREAMKFRNVAFVIIYDDRSRTQLVPMSASDKEPIFDRMLFVSHTTGLQLRQILNEQSNNSTDTGGLIITMDSRIPDYNYGRDDSEEWVMAAMSGVFAFIACIGCLLVCVQAGFLPAADPSIFGGERLMTVEQVHKLPSVDYGEEPQTHQTSCAICIEEYEQRDKLRQLPCKHVFHTECVIPWLTERHSSCPLCKNEVLPIAENDDDTSLSNGWWTSYGSLMGRVLPWRRGRVLVASEDHDDDLGVDTTVVPQEEPLTGAAEEPETTLV